MASKLISQDFIYGVYIPSAVVIFGVGVAAFDYLPFAFIVPILLGGLQYFVGVVTSEPPKALDPKEFQEYPLQKRTEISHNVNIYRFGLPSSQHILGLPIGQHIAVTAKIDGADVLRSYTPISSDDNAGYFDLLVKTYPTGKISKHLSELEVGQPLKVKGPKGQMVYSTGLVRKFGMIAGGTGITPMLQIIRAITKARPKYGGGDLTEIDLIFANVNEEDILLRGTLDRLAADDPRFRVHYVLNNPPEGWKGGSGFVTADMIKEHLPAPANDIKILICGPGPMTSAMKKATESLGYEKANPVSKLPDQVFCF